MPLTDDVKQRLGIVDVVSEYVALNRLGSRNPEALCPFHQESTPSFKLNTEHDTWRCFGACQSGGDIFSFVEKIENIEFTEALDKLCDKAGIERRRDDDAAPRPRKPSKSETDAIRDVNAVAADYWHKQLGTPAGADASAYLESRGIDLETAQRWKIGYAPAGPDSLMHYLKSMGVPSRTAIQAGVIVKPADGAWRDMFHDRITFAIFDRHGNVAGFAGRTMADDGAKYINTHETAVFRKSELLYGMHRASDAIQTLGRAVIVEGYMDVIAAHTHGIRNVVASMGTAVTMQHLRALVAALPPSGDRRELVFALDNDDAGQQAAMDSLRGALEALRTRHQSINPYEIKVAAPMQPSDGNADDAAPKDPDEAIRQDAALWQQSIDAAHEAYQFIFETQQRRGGDALATVEPFIGNPASDTDRVRWLAERLELDYTAVSTSLTHLRTAREQSEAAQRAARSAANRTKSHAVNGNGFARERGRYATARNHRAATPNSQYVIVEYELAACLMQHASALDYAEQLEPSHFSSPRLARLFELRLECDSPDAVEPLVADDAELLALFQELRAYTVEMDGIGDADDESRLMIVVNECTRRTKELTTRGRIRGIAGELQQSSEDPERTAELVGESTRASRSLSGLLTSVAT